MLQPARWIEPDSFEAAALQDGVDGVRKRAKERVDMDIIGQMPRWLVPMNVDWLESEASSLQWHGDWANMSPRLRYIAHKVATLPLTALCARESSATKIDRRRIEDLHTRLENARQKAGKVTKARSPKKQLRVYCAKGESPKRRLSAKAGVALAEEWGGNNLLKCRYLPPEPYGSIIIEAARKEDHSNELGEFAGRYPSLSDGEEMVIAWEALSESAQQALMMARERLVRYGQHAAVELSQPVVRYLAGRAAAKMRGSRSRNPVRDALAADLWHLHADICGLPKPDVKRTSNVGSGTGFAFAEHAFGLYKLPWSTSGHLIKRAEAARAARLGLIL